MSYWSNLVMKAGSDAVNAAAGIRYRYSETPDGHLRFVSKSAYKWALAHWLKREVIALAASEINQLFPRYQRSLEKKLRATVQEQQKDNVKWIIKNSVFAEDVKKFEYGKVTVQGGTAVYARDSWGHIVKEALMIYFDGEDDITVKHNRGGLYAEEDDDLGDDSYTTKTILFFDCCPKINISSGKNIIMTQVQGRDFTRKELVSGGDLTFTVSGSIVSNLAALETSETGTTPRVKYPENEVKKFIQIMQHPGIINVNHFLFRQFNVTRIIIKDFSLRAPEYKNIQPYEFTCVAVEPDEAVIVKQDTIDRLNREIIASPMNKWYKFILDSKLGEIAGNVATDIVGSATSLGLDKLTMGASI